jgi:putative toxin-antitoxin system antitoxin component (TIGR02293 family)
MTNVRIFESNVTVMKKYQLEKDTVSLAQEPELFYLIDNKYDRIASILGGVSKMGQVVNSDIDLIDITRKGLPKSVLFTVSDILNISMEKISELLHISHRTIQRKDDDALLNVSSTEQILEIAEVISRGIEVLGTLDNFTSWVHSEIRVLSYKKPLDYLDTSFGAKLIKDILGRIAHGVYS